MLQVRILTVFINYTNYLQTSHHTIQYPAATKMINFVRHATSAPQT